VRGSGLRTERLDAPAASPPAGGDSYIDNEVNAMGQAMTALRQDFDRRRALKGLPPATDEEFDEEFDRYLSKFDELDRPSREKSDAVPAGSIQSVATVALLLGAVFFGRSTSPELADRSFGRGDDRLLPVRVVWMEREVMPRELLMIAPRPSGRNAAATSLAVAP